MKELFTRVSELTASVISELYCIGMSQSYNSTTHEYNLNTISKTNRIITRRNDRKSFKVHV